MPPFCSGAKLLGRTRGHAQIANGWPSCEEKSYSKVRLSETILFKSSYSFAVSTSVQLRKRSFLIPRQAEEVLQCEDLLGWTVSSLKDVLSLKGLKQTGRKPQLVASVDNVLKNSWRLHEVFLPCLVLDSTFTRTSSFSSALLKKIIVVRFDVFVITLVLEDRIIHIKRCEISELFGVFLYFPHQKWRPCQDL